MSDARRWSVTYTRHLKQKRKVYQDGALELFHSSNKLVLYDDSGKTLESRFLNKDEVIESGGMLAFDNHLVDIGEIEKDCKQLKELNIQGKDSMVIKRTSVLLQKPRHSSSSENKKVKLQNVGASVKHQNMIHNDARDVNKKGQLHNSGVTQTTVRGWHALYTTQITQKAKKYHDGILRLSLCGSHGKQVMLYDDSRNLLDSRFLKKDEKVESGCTLAFVAHLVEIGEPEEPHKPLKDLNFRQRDLKSNEKTLMQAQSSRQGPPAENKKTKLKQNGKAQTCLVAAKNSEKNESQENEASNSHPNTTDNSVTEWHALYTSHLMQKAKKYHDGILQLSCCGSHGKQVILLSEDGRILGSKYIKSSEKVRTGTVFELSKYLVDVGEQRTSQGGNLQHDISSVPVLSKSSRSNANMFNISDKAARHKLLRDANQILSIIKKPSAEESLDHTERVIEQAYCMPSSDFVESFVQGILPEQNLHGLEDPKPNAAAGTVRDDVGNPEEDNTSKTGTSRSGSDLPNVTATQEVLFSELTNLMDHGHRQKPFPESSAIIESEYCTAMLGISEAELDMKHIGGSVTHLAVSVDAPQVSVIVTSDLFEDGQIPSTKLSTSSNGICCGNIASTGLPDCLKDDEQVQGNLRFTKLEGGHPDEGSTTDASSGISAERDISSSRPSHIAQILQEAKYASEKQVCAGDAAVDGQGLNETLSSVCSVNVSGVAHDENNALKEKSNEIPSFDLGI